VCGRMRKRNDKRRKRKHCGCISRSPLHCTHSAPAKNGA
jgi:hypothetical protein